MRVEQVTAHAFGPLVEQRLDLAPGMTVLHGDNESAKSSWHAAVYAALCGRRRSKGRPTKDDARFADLHQPWDSPERWRVSCTIVLDGGRRVELRHDLAGMVDCRATDLGTGRDVSDEVMFEGAPDASRWLGLDRRSFAATATVNQAEMLSVLLAADGLQEHLQRAAANAHTDSTAAQALNALTQFQREHVGLDRSNSTKPLRRAQSASDIAERRLDGARRLHQDYLLHVSRARQLGEQARAADATLEGLQEQVAAAEMWLEAAQAATALMQEADRLAERHTAAEGEVEREQRRLERVLALDSSLDGVPPAQESTAEAHAALVAEALARWRAAPALMELTGPSAAELLAQLTELPHAPQGDTRAHATVLAAERDYERARDALSEHRAHRPAARADTGASAAPELAKAIDVGPRTLRELAHTLDTPRPEDRLDLLDALTEAEQQRETAQALLNEAHQRAAEARAEARAAESALASETARAIAGAEARAVTSRARASRSTLRRSVAAAVAALALAAALTLGLTGQLAGAIAAGLLALASCVPVLLLSARRTSRSDTAASDTDPVTSAAEQRFEASSRQLSQTEAASAQHESQLAAVERAVAAARVAVEEHQRTLRAADAERDKTRARCDELGLPNDPAGLRELAAEAERAALQAEAESRWQAEQQYLRDRETSAGSALRAALAARGTTDPDRPIADLLTDYQVQCQDRARLAEAAAERPALEERLASRREREENLDRVTGQRAAAIATLRQAAQALNVVPGPRAGAECESPEALVQALVAWQRRHAAEQAELTHQRALWSELQTLLDGARPEDLITGMQALRTAQEQARSQLEQARARAQAADQALTDELRTAGIDCEADVPTLTALRDRLRRDQEQARHAASEARAEAATAHGALTQQARALPSVPEAEEHLAACRQDLTRIRDLDQVLELTQQFLRNAQDAVHRDIAPVLSSSLTAWLPRVTDERYHSAAVDPKDLKVRISAPGAPPRESELLSRGTAEQVYLLLRIALSHHLARADESCPLLLDDVTVQCDEHRTLRLLGLLHELSADQQIVLFAQESFVAEWAQRTLTGPTDKVIHLPRVAAT